jgi:hypothetical protein
MIDLYSGMYLKTEDTKGSTLKMTFWKTCTMAVPDADADKSPEDEVVVVDLAEDDEDDKGTDSASSGTDNADTSESDDEEPGVESSVGAPGFELVFGVLGLFCAVLIRRN